MSKNVIFIVNLSETKKQGRNYPYKFSVKSWKTWCDKNNCELFVLTERIYPEEYMNANWHKLFVFQLLENSGIDYDQIMIVDADKWFIQMLQMYLIKLMGSFVLCMVMVVMIGYVGV